MSKTILVVDDKESLRQLVKSYLTQEGFNVIQANNGRDALFVAREKKPDLILLDLMMPQMSGFEFMRAFQKEASTPIIILTAKVEENDKVLGLELGADDYITKPFSMRELTARVRAVLRRLSKAETDNDLLRAGELTVDRHARLVKRGDEFISLTPSEFEILTILMRSPGRAFTRGELLDQLQQGVYFEGYERTIDVHIRNLRTKVERDTKNPRYIETVYGVGYRFKIDA